MKRLRVLLLIVIAIAILSNPAYGKWRENQSPDILTTDGADPGTATASLASPVTYLVTNNAGADPDEVILPDGQYEGQKKGFILHTDNENAGVRIIPATVSMDGNGGAGTSTLFEDAGDSCEFQWVDSTIGWIMTKNIGGTGH